MPNQHCQSTEGTILCTVEDFRSLVRVAALSSICSTDSIVYCCYQDLCQLLNAEQPYWLVGMTEMTRTLCLELMEEVLSNYYSVFLQVSSFDDNVCIFIVTGLTS